MTTTQDRADETNAAEYVATAMRSRLETIRVLTETASGTGNYSNDELERAGLEFEGDSREDAFERLRELPLSVETITLFEVVLGAGGPDDRLTVECDQGPGACPGVTSYEIRRIVYRYSWDGYGERVLTGDDFTAAATFASQVVPELAG
jgi:hypothetical protein